MQPEISDLRHTIIPRSDQLNAEQLLSGPMTITVTDVRIGSSDEQPISIHYENDAGRPYKPCKTMRKVLIFAWGQNGHEWAGRQMTLYNDPAVKFGGSEVGGIRISHISDIERDLQVSLTATKGKKALHCIKRLEMRRVDHAAEIEAADTIEALKAAFKGAYRSTTAPAKREAFKAAYDARIAALTALAPGKTLARFVENIDSATDAETAALVLDEARETLTPTEFERLTQAHKAAWL